MLCWVIKDKPVAYRLTFLLYSAVLGAVEAMSRTQRIDKITIPTASTADAAAG
jgi:hypothetical protein